MPKNISDRETRDRTLRWIWTAMLGTLAIYLGLGQLLEGLPPPEIATGWPAESLLNLFYAAAIGLFALNIVLRTLIRRLRENKPGRDDAVAADPAAADARLFALSMASFVLAESIALLGLLEYWMVRAQNPFYLLMATAFAALLVSRPQDRGTHSAEEDRGAP